MSESPRTMMPPTSFRACETCRSLKIRCEAAQVTASTSTERPPCRRCRDTGTPCTYTEPRRTKRKRTDVRVRELEREVQKLSELLMLRRRAAEDGDVLPVDGGGSPAAVPTETPISATAREPEVAVSPAQQPLPPAPVPAPSTTIDPVVAGLLTRGQAVRLFRRFVTTMAPQRPFVVFPTVTLSAQVRRTAYTDSLVPGVADMVRKKTPVLFLSIMTAAVGTGVQGINDGFGAGDDRDSTPDYEALGTSLDTLLLRAYTDRIMYKGEKSIELIQALLISANWNFYYYDQPFGDRCNGDEGPGGRGKEPSSNGSDNLRFYQHLHMAATMAGELESAGRARGDSPLPDPLAFERTLLSCYVCCSSISLGFHRQTMLSFTPTMEGYLKQLQTSPQAASTDPVMIAWVQLQRVADTTAGALGLRALVGNTGGSATSIDQASLTATYEKIPDLTDPGVQRSLRSVTRRLEQWRQDHSRCMTNSLLMQYNTILCLLHESCFYSEFDPSDLKPPYRVSIPPASARTKQPAPLTPAHITSRRICLTAARSLVGVFLAAPTEQLLGSPVVVYARVGYSILLLLKLQTSAALPGGAMNGILLETATGNSATQIYHYLESTIARLEELSERGGRIAAIWLTIFKVISQWYETYFFPAARGVPVDETNGAGIGPVLVPLKQCLLSHVERDGPRTGQRSGWAPELVPEPGYERQGTPPDRDHGVAALFSGYDTSFCSILASLTPEEEQAILSTAFAADDIERWMSPRVGRGDIHNQRFEYSGL